MTESDDPDDSKKARSKRARKAEQSLDDKAIFSLADWGMEKHFLIHSGKRAENSTEGWPRVMARDNDTRALSKLHLLASEVVKSQGNQFEPAKGVSLNGILYYPSTMEGPIDCKPLPKNHKLNRTSLGQRILDALRIDYHAMRVQYPNHRMSPIYEVFLKVTNALPEFMLRGFIDVNNPEHLDTEPAMRLIASTLNTLTDFLRLRWRSVSEEYANFCRSPIENYNGFMDEIDSLCAANRKLMILHLDLHEQPASDADNEHEESRPCERVVMGGNSQVTLEGEPMPAPPDRLSDPELIARLNAMKKARTAFQLEVNRRFKKRLLGYGWCLEFGTRRAWHYHYLIFLKPKGKEEDDAELVNELGAVWLDKKPGGDYYSANAHKEEYKHLAAGLVDTSNPNVREGLKYKAGYMTLPGLYVQTLLPEASRSFGRGGFDDETPKAPPSDWRKKATWQAVRRLFNWI